MSLKRKRQRFRKKLRNWKNAIQKAGTLNLILTLVFVYMIIFNQQMVIVYMVKGSAPETAWCALIAALIGECGICGWIRTTKDKQRDRELENPAGAKPVNPVEDITTEDVSKIINGLEEEEEQ